MDAKPQRLVRASVVQVSGLENIVPTKSSVHQRHKSAGNLKNMANTGALNVAAKRTAFGDVSNTARAPVDIGTKDMVKNRITIFTGDKENVNQVTTSTADKENVIRGNDGFHRPAQRPACHSTKPCLSVLSTTTASSLNTKTVASDSLSTVMAVKHTNAKKATIVSNNAGDAKAAAPVEISSSVDDSAIPVVDKPVKNPRHYKSQPLLKLEQPNLRRTQSRQLDKLDDLISFDDDVTGAPYVDAVEEQYKAPSVSESLQTTIAEEDVIQNADGDENWDQEPEAPYIQSRLIRDMAPSAVLSETEEYWDEEEEEVYDEQGFTTAHSYRSHGDNTTGGVTALVAPKLTTKVRQELELAKALVEESRTPEDIEEESWDVSMVAEYGEEIFEYMKTLETRMTPNPHYMEIQTEIQWSMRSVLMDWLIQVHNRFALLPETLFLTVNYIDRFLSVKIVSLGKLQLVGATAIFVAAKYEEINCPSVQEIVYMVDSGYTVDEILKAERFMLSMLGFELGWPGPMSFLRRISKADDYDLETRTLAKYFLEVTIMDERFVGCPPSFVAAGAHCLSRLILKKGDWSTAHVHYSGYTFNQLKPLVSMIFDCCQSPRTHHGTVYEKYADRRYKRASEYVAEQIEQGFTLPWVYTSAPPLDDSAHHPPFDLGLLIPTEG